MSPLRPPLVVEDTGIPLFHFSLASRRGSVADPEGKAGTTRLLLRLMRRSVRRITPEELDERLDAMGATLGVEVNRSASAIHGGCISRSRPEFLDLVQRIVCEPDFSESEFVRLLDETRAEWVESLDNDSLLARRFFTRALFLDHPYGHLPGGTPQSLARITLADLEAQYSRVFTQDSLQVALAGEVTDEAKETASAGLISRLSRNEIKERDLGEPVGPQGRHLTFVDKPERTQTQILIGCLGTHPRDDDHTALFVAHTIFGGTFSARLSREVRGKRGWSYGASSDLPFDRQRQAFSLWTFPQASDAAACIDLELSLLKQFIEAGVSDDELEAAQSYLENSYVFSIDTAAKRVALALDRYLYDLPNDYHDAYVDRIRSVTREKVEEAIRRRFSHENLEITVLGTHSDIGRTVEDAIGGLRSSTVVSFDTPE